MRASLRIFVFCALGALACGFSKTQGSAPAPAQPKEERQAQDVLPQSKHPIWATFGACKLTLDEKKYVYSIRYTPEVQALDGKEVTVGGFMLPLEPKEKFKHFLLSKRTPTCPFCPPGEPNEIVEVFSEKPMEWAEALTTMTGTLHLVNKGDKGIFFQLSDATPVP